MRALDGYSEQVLRDTGGDKAAGQQLAREAHHLERQQLGEGKDQDLRVVLDPDGNRAVRDANGSLRVLDVDAANRAADARKAADSKDARPMADGKDARKPSELRLETQKNGDQVEVRRAESRSFMPSNDGRKPPDVNETRQSSNSEARRSAEPNETRTLEARRTSERNDLRTTAAKDARRAAEQSDTRIAEQREARRAAERNDARIAEQREARRATERNDARLAEQREARRAAERNDARIAEQKEARRASEAKEVRRIAEAKEARRVETETKPESGDSKFMPSMLDGRKWQQDGSGTFVTQGKDGRLVTQDAEGKIVDYQSHVNQKHMANQDQMAFLSILFCNPLMLTGMGAALGIMDQNHASKTAKMTESLTQKLDGKNANKAANQNGYASDVSRKASLIAQYTRPMEPREASRTNGLAGMLGASTSAREEMRKQELKRKQRAEEIEKRPAVKASMPTDRYSMSAKKLMKTKKLIEDEIERVRGKASLEEVSRLHSQVEVLEKALKRMANF